MQHTLRLGIASATLALIGLSCVTTRANIALSFEELVTDADVIFLGRVVDSRPYWDEGPWGRAIVTRVVFAVERIYKGSPMTQTSLEFTGGTIGDTTLKVEAMPTFKEGDRDVLFAKSGARLVNPIVGAPFGRFRVVRDSRGLDLVTAFNGNRFATTDRIGQPQTATPQAMSLQEFEHQIAQVLKRSR